MTQDQYEHSTRLVLNEYFIPMFQIGGALCAFIVIALAVILVVKPFVRRT